MTTTCPLTLHTTVHYPNVLAGFELSFFETLLRVLQINANHLGNGRPDDGPERGRNSFVTKGSAKEGQWGRPRILFSDAIARQLGSAHRSFSREGPSQAKQA